MVLNMGGKVEQFVDLNPRYVRLQGAQGEAVSQSVEITPNPKHPFTVRAVSVVPDTLVSVDLARGIQGSDKGYTLTVTNKTQNAGRFSANVVLETDNQQYREIKVPVHLYLTAPAPPPAPQPEAQGSHS